MSSEKKVRSNRRNGARSTGPRTSAGKKKSSKNALRHGFAQRYLPDSDTQSRIQDLASVLIGEIEPTPDRIMMAEAAAEAQIRLDEVKALRCRIIDERLADRECDGELIVTTYLAEAESLRRLDRYLREFEATRRKALRALDKSAI